MRRAGVWLRRAAWRGDAAAGRRWHVGRRGSPNLFIFADSLFHESREKETDLPWTRRFFKKHGTELVQYDGDDRRKVASDSDPLSAGSSENEGRLGMMGGPTDSRSTVEMHNLPDHRSKEGPIVTPSFLFTGSPEKEFQDDTRVVSANCQGS